MALTYIWWSTLRFCLFLLLLSFDLRSFLSTVVAPPCAAVTGTVVVVSCSWGDFQLLFFLAAFFASYFTCSSTSTSITTAFRDCSFLRTLLIPLEFGGARAAPQADPGETMICFNRTELQPNRCSGGGQSGVVANEGKGMAHRPLLRW